MKQLPIVFLMLFVLLYAAHAEGVYYYEANSQQEICYHATPLCIDAGGANDVISEADAKAKGLLPCPICVQEAADPQGVRAVARGGTYVLKMTDEWMNTHTDIGGVFAGVSSEVYTGDDMAKPLSQRLHGDAYISFLEAIECGGSASAPAYYPAIYPQNDELQMCQRHIGGAWYTVLRPSEAAQKAMSKKGMLKIYLRFFGRESIYADGTLTLGEGDEWGNDEYELKFEKMGSKAVFTRDYDGLTLSLFEEVGTNIFVLREHNADADMLVDVGLTLGGRDTGLSLTGYMDGTNAVYVGVFTAPEAKQVKDGAVVTLVREPWLTEEAYQGTDYAIVKKGTAGIGMVDRSGSFVIPTCGEEGAQYIYRYGDTFFVHSVRKPQSLRVIRMENGAAVELTKLDAPLNGFVTYGGSNQAVFLLNTGSRSGSAWYVYDMDTGEKIAELPVNELASDAPGYGTSPSYRLETAKPQRLVLGDWNRESGSAFWLADNWGNRISENFQCVEALSWSDAGGLFLVSTWDESEHDSMPNDQEDLFAGYDGRQWFGPRWRCGIIDHNGNLLAPCAYTKVTLLTATRAQLETPEGQRVVVELENP